jgi:hypothetical protein
MTMIASPCSWMLYALPLERAVVMRFALERVQSSVRCEVGSDRTLGGDTRQRVVRRTIVASLSSLS